MHSRKSSIATLLSNQGIILQAMPKASSFRQKWREAFASEMKADRGLKHRGAVDWHTFSFGFSRSVEGKRAIQIYHRARRECRFVLIVDFFHRARVYRSRGPLPSYELLSEWNYGCDIYVDIYVSPSDWSWTFVLTHERTPAPISHAVERVAHEEDRARLDIRFIVGRGVDDLALTDRFTIGAGNGTVEMQWPKPRSPGTSASSS